MSCVTCRQCESDARTHSTPKALRAKFSSSLFCLASAFGESARPCVAFTTKFYASTRWYSGATGHLACSRFKRANAWVLRQKRRMITKNIGMLLLAIYLILVGITTLFHIAIGAIVMGIVALIAGILILIGK
jgi:hypothetical protein